jgi:hypothetical protein
MKNMDFIPQLPMIIAKISVKLEVHFAISNITFEMIVITIVY